jgi:hypothetical protein
MRNTSILKRLPEVALALLAAAMLSAANTPMTPPPGTLNYVEGQVSIQGQEQTPKSIGTSYLGPNQVLETQNGNAEVLLTPGVYLRIGHNSEVEMVSPELTNTEVKLMAGSAMVEVDQLYKENDISVLVGDARARVESKGLYGFEASPAAAAVLDGKALVSEGDRQVRLKKGREVRLDGLQLKAQSLPKEAVENDPLYRWSKLRSEYASESNVNAANALVAEGGWLGPGWYWDPFWMDFAFLPGAGMFWGPFGWPFFSPAWVGFAPYYGIYPVYGYHHYPVAGTRAAAGTGLGKGTLPPLARHAAPGAGFRSAPRAIAVPDGGMGMRIGPPMAAHMGMGVGGFRGFGHGR